MERRRVLVGELIAGMWYMIGLGKGLVEMLVLQLMLLAVGKGPLA